MKKYLLLLGCACMALSALADDTDINKARTTGDSVCKIASWKAASQFPVLVIDGGKPRFPVKPLSLPGTVSLFSKDDGSTMSNMHVGGERNFVKADLVEFGKEPLGGKPRDPGRPLSIDDFLNNVRNNSSFSSSKPTIDDVTSLIDQLLYEGQGQAKSVNDVTTMIDQMLIQPK